MSCCPPNSLPFLARSADYAARGAVSLLGDLPIYTVGSAECRKAVIVGYDIYGFDAGRTREVCDYIADAGYYVLLPDFMRGAAWTPELEVNEPEKKGPFIKSFSKPEDILRDTTSLILPFLQEQGIAKIAFAGFCFGGYVAYLVSQLEGGLTCALGVHSSIRIFNFHGSNENEATRLVTCPQMLIQAGNDSPDGKPGSEVETILLSKPFGASCVLKEFPDMVHGWTLRGDLTDEKVARDVALTMDLIMQFLNTHLNTVE